MEVIVCVWMKNLISSALLCSSSGARERGFVFQTDRQTDRTHNDNDESRTSRQTASTGCWNLPPFDGWNSRTCEFTFIMFWHSTANRPSLNPLQNRKSDLNQRTVGGKVGKAVGGWLEKSKGVQYLIKSSFRAEKRCS